MYSQFFEGRREFDCFRRHVDIDSCWPVRAWPVLRWKGSRSANSVLLSRHLIHEIIFWHYPLVHSKGIYICNNHTPNFFFLASLANTLLQVFIVLSPWKNATTALASNEPDYKKFSIMSAQCSNGSTSCNSILEEEQSGHVKIWWFPNNFSQSKLGDNSSGKMPRAVLLDSPLGGSSMKQDMHVLLNCYPSLIRASTRVYFVWMRFLFRE